MNQRGSGKAGFDRIFKNTSLSQFIKNVTGKRNVTNLSKTLGVEKYTVSRVFTALEKDGYLNRTDSRHPRLEKLG